MRIFDWGLVFIGFRFRVLVEVSGVGFRVSGLVLFFPET